MDLVYTSDADAALTRLEGDPGRALTLQRIEAALDELAADPSAPVKSPRVYRLRDAMAAGFTLPCQGEEWLIMWSRAENEIIVRYIGPDL